MHLIEQKCCNLLPQLQKIIKQVGNKTRQKETACWKELQKHGPKISVISYCLVYFENTDTL